MPEPRIAVLYHTPALPMHWVAEDEEGRRWKVPVSPLAPHTWQTRRTPYRGNYDLTPVIPQSLIRFYHGDDDGRLIRIGEAAARAGCTDVTLRAAADRGELPVASRIGARGERRFRPEDVDAWAAGERPA